MKKIKLLLSSIGLLFFLNACTQQNKTKQMEEIIQEIYKNVHIYKQTPVYSVQVNKTGCRLVIEIKGNKDYRFTESNGESELVPLNYFITQSGKQTAIIKVYPKEGEQYISKYAMVNLTFYKSPDKDSNMESYREIAKYSLPQGLEEKKLPYYEAEVGFEADVPFDYSKELDSAQDLTKIPDIEKKAIQKYSVISSIIFKREIALFEKEHMFSNIRMFETLYQTSLEEIKKNESQMEESNIFGAKLNNREMLPIENCLPQLYAGGKIIALWNKTNLESPMRIKGTYKRKDGSIGNYEESIATFLYMPAGSNELKVW